MSSERSLYAVLITVCTNECDSVFYSCYDEENVAHAVQLSLAQADGSQEVPYLDFTVAVVGQFCSDWQRAPWSSNCYGAWHYGVRERLSSWNRGKQQFSFVFPSGYIIPQQAFVCAKKLGVLLLKWWLTVLLLFLLFFFVPFRLCAIRICMLSLMYVFILSSFGTVSK